MLKTLNRLLNVVLIVVVIGVAALWITQRKTERPGDKTKQIEQKIIPQKTTQTSPSTAAEHTSPGPENSLRQAADSPYSFVYWYIDDAYQGISGGPSTSAYFSPNPSEFPGSSDGTTYTIKAVAYQYDPDTNLMLSDTRSYTNSLRPL